MLPVETVVCAVAAKTKMKLARTETIPRNTNPVCMSLPLELVPKLYRGKGHGGQHANVPVSPGYYGFYLRSGGSICEPEGFVCYRTPAMVSNVDCFLPHWPLGFQSV